MSTTIDELGIYLHLARAFWRKKQMPDRDRLLVLGGVTAAKLDLLPISLYCRSLILQNNPGHMVRRWQSLSIALHDEDFLHFLKQLKRRFPSEKAESILSGFGVMTANERSTYYSDAEYAAAVLGVDLDWLRENYESDV
jgi:hypothetical protein